MFHYKKGSAYKTSADSAVLYQDVASNTLLNDVFCYFVHNLPKFQNMHPYRITPGTDIAEHVGTTYPALPGPPAVPDTYLLIRHAGGAQEWGSDGRHGCGRPGPTHHSGCRQGGWEGGGRGRGGHSGNVLRVLFIGVVDEVDLQVMMACMLAVLAVSQCESCAGLDLRQSQGILAFQFENGGRLRSNPVQEIHDQVDHDLHGPHRDGSHRHGEASRWPPAIIVCRPRLEELVDSFGELLSEGLVAVPRADMERRGPSCAINQQSVISF